MAIPSLPSRVAREQAVRRLSPSIFQRWLTGKLLLIADLYIPYRLYKVTCEDPKLQAIRYYAIDAIAGILDPYEFPSVPRQDEVETRNFLPASLEESRTRELAVEKTRRVIFSRGFFRIARPLITAELIEPELYVPYWAGFYGARENLSVVVLDAVRGSIEGKKAAQVVKACLADVHAL